MIFDQDRLPGTRRERLSQSSLVTPREVCGICKLTIAFLSRVTTVSPTLCQCQNEAAVGILCHDPICWPIQQPNGQSQPMLLSRGLWPNRVHGRCMLLDDTRGISGGDEGIGETAPCVTATHCGSMLWRSPSMNHATSNSRRTFGLQAISSKTSAAARAVEHKPSSADKHERVHKRN